MGFFRLDSKTQEILGDPDGRKALKLATQYRLVLELADHAAGELGKRGIDFVNADRYVLTDEQREALGIKLNELIGEAADLKRSQQEAPLPGSYRPYKQAEADLKEERESIGDALACDHWASWVEWGSRTATRLRLRLAYTVEQVPESLLEDLPGADPVERLRLLENRNRRALENRFEVDRTSVASDVENDLRPRMGSMTQGPPPPPGSQEL